MKYHPHIAFINVYASNFSSFIYVESRKVFENSIYKAVFTRDFDKCCTQHFNFSLEEPIAIPKPYGTRFCVLQSLCFLVLLFSNAQLNGKEDQKYFTRQIVMQLHWVEQCLSKFHANAEPHRDLRKQKSTDVIS